MAIWNALRIATQVAGELGLDVPASLVSTSDKIASQLLSLMNAAGAELLMYFPWEQLAKEYAPAIIANQDAYALPADFAYFRDQTQWDRTNRWPLMGPKSAQEWAFLKGSLVAALPRQRFRLQGGSFVLFPAPTSALNIRAEYISEWWVGLGAGSAPVKDTITLDTDLIYYNPWLIVKFVKFTVWFATVKAPVESRLSFAVLIVAPSDVPVTDRFGTRWATTLLSSTVISRTPLAAFLSATKIFQVLGCGSPSTPVTEMMRFIIARFTSVPTTRSAS